MITGKNREHRDPAKCWRSQPCVLYSVLYIVAGNGFLIVPNSVHFYHNGCMPVYFRDHSEIMHMRMYSRSKEEFGHRVLSGARDS